MPINAKNRARYPANWPEIRKQILERAGDKCEWCGVPNYAWRIPDGSWSINDMQAETWSCCDGLKVTRIVLTIAHLDHMPEHCDPSNLRALCQSCHLRYDAPMHARNARETRRQKKAIGELFEATHD